MPNFAPVFSALLGVACGALFIGLSALVIYGAFRFLDRIMTGIAIEDDKK